MKVVLSARHPLLTHALANIVRTAYPGSNVIECCSAVSAIEHLDAAEVKLLIVDFELSDVVDFAFFENIRATHPCTKLIVLSRSYDRSVILGCLAAGVHAYILDSTGIDHIAAAITQVVAGEVVVPSCLAAISETGAVEPVTSRSDLAGLTVRQQQVLTRLANGESTKQIARSLGLGVGTVKVHIAGIYRALRVSSRSEALCKLYAQRNKGEAVPGATMTVPARGRAQNLKAIQATWYRNGWTEFERKRCEISTLRGSAGP